MGDYEVSIPNGKVRYARYPLKIGPSAIHGLGVFSLGFIPKGRRIAKWQDGREMTYQQVKALYTGPDGRIDWRYVYKTRPYQMQIVNKEWSERNINNYVNDGHHGQTNPRHNVKHERRWLVATQDIQPGEEILLDCGKAYWASSQHS